MTSGPAQQAQSIGQAQRQIRDSNAGGAAGVFVSGIAWQLAGLVWQYQDIKIAFAVLFVGGTLAALYPALVPLNIAIWVGVIEIILSVLLLQSWRQKPADMP